MATVEIEKPKLLKATPALARKFRDMERFPRDRDLSLRRLEFIKSKVRSGEFRGSEWVSAHCNEDSKTYRLNGRHTSTALCDLFEEGIAIEATMLVRDYVCDTMEDMARLYSSFDPKQSARTKANIIQSFAGIEPSLSEISSKTISLAASGLAFNLWEGQESRHSAEDCGMLVIQHSEFVAWFATIVPDDHRFKHMRRAPVAAAMARTYFKSKTAATEFWTMVRDDCDLPAKSGPRQLHKWLITHGLFAEKGSAIQHADRREMMVRCLHGWNAWRKGETTTLQYFSNAKTPAAA